MNTAVVQSRKPFRQDLRFYVPRWMAVVVVITLIQQLTTATANEQSFWSIPGLVLIGLLEGAFGAAVFVGLQRWWNPKNSRVVRLRNSVLAWILVAVGSLWVMTAIYS